MENKTVEAEVAVIENEVVTFKERAEHLVIKSDEDNAEATTVLSELTTRKKGIEEARKFFVDPLNAQVKAINEKFKPQTERLDEVIQIIKTKVGAYHLAQEKKRADEQERLDKIRREADAKRIAEGKETIATPVRQVEEKQQTTKTTTGSATVKKVWKFKIVSFKDLPKDIKVLIMTEAMKAGIGDTVVRKMVNAGVREMAGVEIYQDTQVSVR